MEQATVERRAGGRERPIVAGLLLLWLLGFLFGGSQLDRELLGWIYARDKPVLTAIAQAFTLLGDWELLVSLGFLAAAFLIWRGRRKLALLLVTGLLLGRLLVGVQKWWFGRIRPDEELWLTGATSLSFPSGHAANSMTTYLVLALVLAPPERRLLSVATAVLLSVCVGASRIMLSVHWPSDVIAGWAFGALWAIGLAVLADRVESSSARR